MAKTIRVATDVGGTFTDIVSFERDDATGATRIRTAKANTTPGNFEQGLLNAIDRLDLKAEAIDYFVHGTTMVINALTERNGVKVGLVTTKGFRDVLEIARGNRPDLFNRMYRKPAPFVPRYLRREVPGRVTYNGVESEPINLSVLPDIVADFRAEGVEAVAICLLHGYANPAHERTVKDELRRLWPEISLVASHQITREWREYERTNTTVFSAYVQPVAERYLANLRGALTSRGFAGEPYIMQSNCGVDTLEAAAEVPITMVESGPASGFWGAAELGRRIGCPDILALDIGGTTAKCSLIKDGQVTITSNYWIERTDKMAGYPVMVPVVDLVEIGNGGGSIATVDSFGKLRVGPRSAGANPGPVAYGRGGTEPTTTDANLVLGRINPDYFCGGEVTADMQATSEAVTRLGSPMGLSAKEAARGIVRIANNNMVNALKLVSVNRGHDPRDFTLLAFGGGGAMHAVALAAELGMRHVVVPTNSGVFSAWGMTMCDMRQDLMATRLVPLDADSGGSIQATVDTLKAEAIKRFASQGFPDAALQFDCRGRFRYRNQEHTVSVLLPETQLDATAVTKIEAAFHEVFEKTYTYRLDAPVEMVGLHLTAILPMDRPQLTAMPATDTPATFAVKSRRLVDFDIEGEHLADIYDGSLLQSGMTFRGPAVVEESGTTTLVHPGNRVEVDGFGNLHIWLGE